MDKAKNKMLWTLVTSHIPHSEYPELDLTLANPFVVGFLDKYVYVTSYNMMYTHTHILEIDAVTLIYSDI